MEVSLSERQVSQECLSGCQEAQAVGEERRSHSPEPNRSRLFLGFLQPRPAGKTPAPHRWTAFLTTMLMGWGFRGWTPSPEAPTQVPGSPCFFMASVSYLKPLLRGTQLRIPASDSAPLCLQLWSPNSLPMLFQGLASWRAVGVAHALSEL